MISQNLEVEMLRIKPVWNSTSVMDGDNYLFDVEFSYSTTLEHKQTQLSILSAMVDAYNAENLNLDCNPVKPALLELP